MSMETPADRSARRPLYGSGLSIDGGDLSALLGGAVGGDGYPSARPLDEPVGIPLVGTRRRRQGGLARSEEHTSELQSLMRISYAVFCLKKKKAFLCYQRFHLHQNQHRRPILYLHILSRHISVRITVRS